MHWRAPRCASRPSIPVSPVRCARWSTHWQKPASDRKKPLFSPNTRPSSAKAPAAILLSLPPVVAGNRAPVSAHTEDDSPPFDEAFSRAVDLGNQIADADEKADLWDVADGLLAGAVQYWL